MLKLYDDNAVFLKKHLPLFFSIFFYSGNLEHFYLCSKKFIFVAQATARCTLALAQILVDTFLVSVMHINWG